MISIILAVSTSLFIALVGTPFLITFFRNRQLGQLIRDDGPQEHKTKRGTPTMGGIVIITAALVGYLVAVWYAGRFKSSGGLLVMGTFVGMGLVGFIDDYIKLRNQRNLGLSSRSKLLGQIMIAILFSLGANYVADTSTQLSFIGPIQWLDLGPYLFPPFAFLIMTATSNAVNLTDGLDGLAAGVSAMVFGAWTVIAYWIFRHGFYGPQGEWAGDYTITAWIHADTVAMAAAAMAGACIGFLWWNAYPAQIFMGDTGSLALGGGMAALAVVTETELLLIILGGLFVLETLSVILQVVYFKATKGKRLFKMAPIHHHFEAKGWHENTVIVRFWIAAAIFVAMGMGIFYAEFLIRVGAFL